MKYPWVQYWYLQCWYQIQSRNRKTKALKARTCKGDGGLFKGIIIMFETSDKLNGQQLNDAIADNLIGSTTYKDLFTANFAKTLEGHMQSCPIRSGCRHPVSSKFLLSYLSYWHWKYEWSRRVCENERSGILASNTLLRNIGIDCSGLIHGENSAGVSSTPQAQPCCEPFRVDQQLASHFFKIQRCLIFWEILKK